MKIQPVAKRPWKILAHWADPQKMRQHEDKVYLLLTLMIGAIVGLVVVAFIVLTENLGARMYPGGGAAWRRLLVPVAGALVTGYLLHRYFPNARGSGIPQTKTALFLHSGVIKLRTVLGKFGCSSVSLASGIALGREGPSVQVGAGIASVLGRQFGLSPANTKALVPIGAAAALAAAFNTPIAAVLFTLEEVMGDLHARVLGAIVMSSATSWMVLHMLLGDEPLFHVPAYQLVHPIEFVFYAVLGAVGGLVSVAFVKLLLGLRKYFLKMPPSTVWFQPVAGGLLVGILGWFVPEVLGVGYGHVSEALNSRLALSTMTLLVALKLIATATCYASGNAGGIFGPSLFLGAMMGGAFGTGAHIFLPDYTGSAGAYALVGMGATFAGIIRVPMTSVIMIFEVTRDYSIIVPLMIANLISYFVSKQLQKEPIYEALMHQDGIDLPTAHREREELATVRQGLRMPEQILRSDDKIEDALMILDQGLTTWPVMDGNRLLGMVSLSQLQEAAQQGHQHAQIADLFPSSETGTGAIAMQLSHLHPDQPLDLAMRRMARSGLTVLPVISRTKSRELVGVLSLNDALAAYKLENGVENSDQAQQDTKSPVAALGGIVFVLVLMIALAVFLNFFYRSQRTARAEGYAIAGNGLMAGGRYEEAVEKFRSALSITHNSKDRLALSTALVKAGHWKEAEIYLRELIREMPGSGPANLDLARIAAQGGDLQDAVNYYHKAIYGSWTDETPNNRIQIRLELVEFLGRSGQLTQARAEVLSLLTETSADVTIRKRVAQMLLDFGLPTESAQAFQEIIRKDSKDADAYVGLGRAEFALGEFHLAEQAFKNALRRNPADVKSKNSLELTSQILALDPNLRGLNAAEKYARSRKLMEATLGSLDQCIAARSSPLPSSEIEIVDGARKSLLNRGKPRSYSDATEANLTLCEQLWKMRINSCGPPKASDEMLSIIMARLSR
jgi:chloride channel protein, CIC family